MKTSELIGPALDWAVATALGLKTMVTRKQFVTVLFPSAPRWTACPDYSTNWAQGGPIIEREKIAIVPSGEGWVAASNAAQLEVFPYDGPTPLTAAMRCFIASKLGDEVEIPEELL